VADRGANLAKALVAIYDLSPHGSTCPICQHRAGGADCGCCRIYRGPKGADGYGRKSYRVNGVKRDLSLHRWVMEQFLGTRLPKQIHVMHLCDNRTCIRFDHLTLGSAGDNNRDMRAKGRQQGGPRVLADDVPCPAGHVGNSRRDRRGYRVYRDCNRERLRRNSQLPCAHPGGTWTHSRPSDECCANAGASRGSLFVVAA
jgi:HNH endonuclease